MREPLGWLTRRAKESFATSAAKSSQRINNKRAQHVTSVEEKKKTEDEIQKDR